MVTTRQILSVGTLVFLIISATLVFVNYQNRENILFLSTTTSVDNTGVLGALIEEFQDQTGIEVKVIAKGSGIAVDLGKKGEVDAILVHAPDLEDQFMEGGYGEKKTTLWFNYFVMVGPKNDPVNISKANSIDEVFNRIFTGGEADETEFYSRGDNSGTHIKEINLWPTQPDASVNDWYKELGTGMSSTLTTANENSGYTISDFGTYTQLKSTGVIQNLERLYFEDEDLYNPYSYLIVSSEVYPELNTDLAYEFLNFLLSEKAFNIVNNFKVGNDKLFTPIGDE